MEMLPSLKDVFDMDRLLKRTFLLLCPLEIYEDFLKKECFSCLEMCITIRKVLHDVKPLNYYKRPNLVSAKL